MKRNEKLLYFITDSTIKETTDFLNVVEAAIKGGADMLQLREKNITTKEYIELATAVHEIAKKYNIPLIIDDRVDVAYAVCADGVHLGRDDLPIRTARQILGNDKIIGATAKTVIQAEKAVSEGADYLGVGAVYPTTTKVKTVLTPVETIHKICKSVSVPVYAIGGLNKDNIKVLENSGICGICVVSAVMKSDNPEKTARELKELIQTL